MADSGIVGAVLEEVSFPVEEGKVREFALAVGDDDTEAVPLTFAAVAGHWRDQSAWVARLGLDLPRIVVGGCEWEHHAPIAVGDRLTGERTVTDVQRSEGRRGAMTFITLETRLHRSDGELAVVQRDTIIELPDAKR
jgi:hydroxyacyl-ACP dehydratase HTD2-like protein with hotdog domain